MAEQMRVPVGGERPFAMPLQRAGLPTDPVMYATLWVIWRWTFKQLPRPYWTKPPFRPCDGRPASHSRPADWATLDQAVAAIGQHDADGIGLVLTKDIGITAIDLDHCRDRETGVVEPWARAIIERLNSYTEPSASGAGIRILIRASLPERGRRRDQIELYDNQRYVTLNGNREADSPATIEPRQAELDALYHELFGTKGRPASRATLPVGGANDDDALLSRARAANDGGKFARLWRGDITGYPSQSEADLAFCAKAAFWTRGDAAAIDRWMRASGLMRADKWDTVHYGDGRTYGQATIAEALRTVTDHYRQTSATKAGDDEDEAIVDISLTDLGNAERLVAQHGPDLRYCYPWRKWLVYDGKRWAVDESGAIERRAKATVRALRAEAANLADAKGAAAIAKFARVSESAARLTAMMNLARSEPTVPVSPGQLDAEPWLLNVANGTLDLRTGALCPHRRDDLLTSLVPVVYDPDATYPSWLAFLDRIMNGNDDLVRFLQRAVGYCLTGDTGERCLFILHGGGANGKTIFLQSVALLLADLALRTPVQTLLARRNEGIPNDVARLRGARFVYSSEIEDGQRLAEAQIKDLTGGDRISARFMRAEWFEFDPTFKIWLGTNHRPLIYGTDNAIWDRIRLIPFTVTIPPEERESRDIILGRHRAELPGILRWAVEGCVAWQRDGLGVPNEVREATAGYRADMDVLAEFLDDQCVIEPRAQVTKRVLFEAWTTWSEANGQRAGTQKLFGQRLAERGFASAREGHVRSHIWLGIGLRT